MAGVCGMELMATPRCGPAASRKKAERKAVCRPGEGAGPGAGREQEGVTGVLSGDSDDDDEEEEVAAAGSCRRGEKYVSGAEMAICGVVKCVRGAACEGALAVQQSRWSAGRGNRVPVVVVTLALGLAPSPCVVGVGDTLRGTESVNDGASDGRRAIGGALGSRFEVEGSSCCRSSLAAKCPYTGEARSDGAKGYCCDTASDVDAGDAESVVADAGGDAKPMRIGEWTATSVVAIDSWAWGSGLGSGLGCCSYSSYPYGACSYGSATSC